MTSTSLQTYRNWLIVGSSILMLLASTPTIATLVHIPDGSQRFSEFWVLDSNHTTDNYPFNVTVGRTYTVYLGVRNHLGNAAYYRIYVKLGNGAQSVPVTFNASASQLSILDQFDFVVKDGDAWETPLVFQIVDAEERNSTLIIGDVSINGITFWANVTSVWDSIKMGFYYQLFSELWLYNATSQAFQYHNRLVQLWLNASIQNATSYGL